LTASGVAPPKAIGSAPPKASGSAPPKASGIAPPKASGSAPPKSSGPAPQEVVHTPDEAATAAEKTPDEVVTASRIRRLGQESQRMTRSMRTGELLALPEEANGNLATQLRWQMYQTPIPLIMEDFP